MRPERDTIDDLVRRIREVTLPVRIILFGSAGRGQMTADSDLDVLVVAPNGTDCRDAANRVYKNLIGFGRSVDLIVTTEDDLRRYGDNFSLVYYPALREGKEIYAA